MLITPAYLEEQKILHKRDDYACCSAKWAYLVAGIATIERCTSVLDYGCGKGELRKEFKRMGIWPFGCFEYDPAVLGKDHLHAEGDYLTKYDLVVCTDVMEHIEPECLSTVVSNLARITERLLFLAVSIKFDKDHWLADGRNAHLIVNDGTWWAEKFIAAGFRIKREWNTGVKEWVALLENLHG